MVNFKFLLFVLIALLAGSCKVPAELKWCSAKWSVEPGSVNSVVCMNYLHLFAVSSALTCHCTSIPTCNTPNITVLGLFWTEQKHCAKIHDDSPVSKKLHIGLKRQQFNCPIVVEQMISKNLQIHNVRVIVITIYGFKIIKLLFLKHTKLINISSS